MYQEVNRLNHLSFLNPINLKFQYHTQNYLKAPSIVKLNAGLLYIPKI